MSRIAIGVALVIVGATNASAQETTPIRPWMTVGLGATSSSITESGVGLSRKEGGPLATIAGGLLIHSKYVIGVQKNAWMGTSFEWGERGSSTVGTVGMIFRDIPAVPFIKLNGGIAEYRSDRFDGGEHFRGMVLGGGLGAIGFPQWFLSPSLSVDASWWINGRALAGPSAGDRITSRELTVTFGLVAH